MALIEATINGLLSNGFGEPKVRKRSVELLCSLIFVVNVFVPAAIDAEELTVERFESLHQQLQASPDEAWRTVPWRISLLQAQRDAVAANKPIFMWAMDGHPLGCT